MLERVIRLRELAAVRVRPPKRPRPNDAPRGGRLDRIGLVILMVGLSLGLATAFLIVIDWKVALVAVVLQLALPMAIVLHRYPFLAVLIWLALNQFLLTTEFLLPYRVAFWIFHRALPPATVGIIVLSTMLRVSRRPLPRLGLPELAMAGYLLASLLSVLLLSGSPLVMAYRLYDRVFIPLCLYLIARLSVTTGRDIQRLAAVACFVCAAQSFTGLLSWITPGALPEGWRSQLGQRTIGSLINTSTYTSALVFAAVLLLHVAMNRRHGPLRALYLTLLAVAVCFIFLSFSRASWLGALAVLLGLVYLYPAFMIRLGLLATPLVTAALSVGVMSHQLDWASERLYSEESVGSALDRLPAFLAAVRMFEAKPLFGWGYQNFELYDRRFQERVFDLANDNKDHANHNAYLTILAEQGAVGLLLYLAPPLWLLARSFSAYRRLPADGVWSRKLLLLLWLATLNIFVQNCFTPAWVTYGLGLWWLNLGLIACLVAGAQTEPRAHLRRTAP